MDVIYLDNNATTRPADEVVEAMLPYLRENWGNPSSMHRMGQAARHGVERARQQMANLLDCPERSVAFTGGGTEAINTAIRGLLAMRAPRRRIVTSSVEHPATRELCAKLEREGVEVAQVAVDAEGRLDLDQLRQSLTEETALATFLWANNETGILFPIEQMATLCRDRGVPVHCDATQAVGKIPVSLRQIAVDVLSCAGHKFHGPKGIGVLATRAGLRLPPLLVGGPQELNRRGGTENVPGIVGMGMAAELARGHLAEMQRVAELRDRLEATITARVPESTVIGQRSPRLPNTSLIGFARLEAEAILLLLSERGLCASAGSACSSGSLEPSHVLKAMGVDERIAHGAVRFSLSRFTTEQEIVRACEIVPQVIQRLRQVLPV